MRRLSILLFLFLLLNKVYALPTGFVYLHDVDPSILQEMRYAGTHNFVGRPIAGYEAGKCILTREAAEALARVQATLRPAQLSLKVYDCYRPVRAVQDFIAWSQNPKQQEMKQEFYPEVNKADFFRLGYVAEKSGHNRGSTVDLTIVPLPLKASAPYQSHDNLVACTAPYQKRYRDNSVDMGTGFDCLDERSHMANDKISKAAFESRLFLRNTMMKAGFDPYEKEWWHFTLKNEPYGATYFNFVVR